VVRALKVAARVAVRVVRRKLPLSQRLLGRCVTSLGSVTSSEFIRMRDAALFVIGWVGMFRSSELVGLRWEFVHFTSRGGVMLFVPQSKTDPGEGAWVFLAPNPAQLLLCPVRCLRLLWEFQGRPASGPVFTSRAGSDQALAKTTIGIRLRKALQVAGVEGWDLYAAHSLQRGGATHAACKGVAL
jgi:integrase